VHIIKHAVIAVTRPVFLNPESSDSNESAEGSG